MIGMSCYVYAAFILSKSMFEAPLALNLTALGQRPMSL
jgi:hypothetical protein